MVEIPTEAELADRIRSHLSRTDGRVDRAAGLGGVPRWPAGVGRDRPGDARPELIDLLPQVDQRACVEIALGEYADEHPDLGRVAGESLGVRAA